MSKIKLSKQCRHGRGRLLAVCAMALERLELAWLRGACRQDHFCRPGEFRWQERRAVRHNGVAIEIEIEQTLCNGILKKIVRLIQDNPMGQTSAAPHDALTPGSASRVR